MNTEKSQKRLGRPSCLSQSCPAVGQCECSCLELLVPSAVSFSFIDFDMTILDGSQLLGLPADYSISCQSHTHTYPIIPTISQYPSKLLSLPPSPLILGLIRPFLSHTTPPPNCSPQLSMSPRRSSPNTAAGPSRSADPYPMTNPQRQAAQSKVNIGLLAWSH